MHSNESLLKPEVLVVKLAHTPYLQVFWQLYGKEGLDFQLVFSHDVPMISWQRGFFKSFSGFLLFFPFVNTVFKQF